MLAAQHKPYKQKDQLNLYRSFEVARKETNSSLRMLREALPQQN